MSANGVPLPAHCQIDGVINKRIGIDGYPYGDGFEVRLPTPADWNGRFMFQGGGGTEGSVPPATGTAGTLSPTLAHGWAVASQDGGHENSELPVPNQFFLDPQAVIDHAYRSIDVTAQTAKYLINVYYGDGPRRSYWVGCSTGGRQGMVMSQNFPDYFDGIVAGDPVYDLEAISLSEDWGVEQIYDITPQPVQRLANGSPILYPAFPLSDQQLFTKAILQACDGLDGTVDGVIDNLPACLEKFDPASYIFSDTHQRLQCTGPKTASCLSKAQIEAVEDINEGPRSSRGQAIRAPAGAVAHDHVDNTVFGYQYDGGFMAPTGIPSRKIGTPTTTPGDYALGLGQLPYIWIQPPDPSFDPLTFNFNSDLNRLNKNSVLVTYSTSLDINTECGYVLRPDDPRCTLAGLPPLEVAYSDHAQRRHLGDADDPCGCIERDLAALSPFAVPVNLDVVVFAESAHPLLRPSVAVARRLARTIEEARDLSIRHQTRQLAHERDRILRLHPTRPAGSIQSKLDL